MFHVVSRERREKKTVLSVLVSVFAWRDAPQRERRETIKLFSNVSEAYVIVMQKNYPFQLFFSLSHLFGFEMSFQLQAIAERDITTVVADREKENCVIPFRLAEHLSSTFWFNAHDYDTASHKMILTELTCMEIVNGA